MFFYLREARDYLDRLDSLDRPIQEVSEYNVAEIIRQLLALVDTKDSALIDLQEIRHEYDDLINNIKDSLSRDDTDEALERIADFYDLDYA